MRETNHPKGAPAPEAPEASFNGPQALVPTVVPSTAATPLSNQITSAKGIKAETEQRAPETLKCPLFCKREMQG